MRYLMVPGIGGSDERHWQSIWEAELGANAARIQPASWDKPEQQDWLAAIDARASAETVLVAHSLGCLAAASWMSRADTRRIAGALLVAPPDQSGPAFPPEASSFTTVRRRLNTPTLVIASSNDPYGSPDFTHELAEDWGASLIEVGAHGHLNGASGLGAWTTGRDLLTAFSAGVVSRRR